MIAETLLFKKKNERNYFFYFLNKFTKLLFNKFKNSKIIVQIKYKIVFNQSTKQ